MATASPPPPGSPFAALGVERGRVIGIAAGLGLGTLSIARSWQAPLPLAITMAAITAIAVLVTAFFLAAGLHRTVVVPVAQCNRLLTELRLGKQFGRLPEAGAPLMLDLLKNLNATAQVLVRRHHPIDEQALQIEAALHRAQRTLDELCHAVLVVDAHGQFTYANRRATEWLCLRPLRPGMRHGLADAPLVGEQIGAAVARLGPSTADWMPASVHAGDRTFALRLARMSTEGPDAEVLVVCDAPSLCADSSDDGLALRVVEQLRAPLTELSSNSRMLAQLDGTQIEAWRQLACELAQESQRLTNMVRDTAQVARNGKHPTQLDPHEAANLTVDAIRLIEPHLQRHGLRFELLVAGPSPIQCDGMLFVDALVRLLQISCARARSDGLLRILVQPVDDRVELSITNVDARSESAPPAPAAPASDLVLPLCRGTIESFGGILHDEKGSHGEPRFRIVLLASSCPAR